ncbi:peptide hydrolase [Favolaschia claudopus]|uniref:Peptide hydrolase n=1 Tax=Favolaschia claudopus TaxID=2862362 RepID=A0AAW0BXL1_9AGAR
MIRSRNASSYKALRAQAASKGLSFKEAILANKTKDEEEGKNFEKPVGSMRRIPGRMNSIGGDEPANEEKRSYNEAMVVSLIDIARPAKRRTMQRVLELKEDNRSERSGEWEGNGVWDMQSEQWETQNGDCHEPDQWEELYGAMYKDGETERHTVLVSGCGGPYL